MTAVDSTIVCAQHITLTHFRIPNQVVVDLSAEDINISLDSFRGSFSFEGSTSDNIFSSVSCEVQTILID
jgi:hypothetical protein